jgi:uncharacterized protein (TIGR02246 family)
MATAVLAASLLTGERSVAQPNPSTADERACWRIVSAQAEAWNRGDAQALAADFSPDGELIASDGRVVAGRDEVAKHQAELFGTVLKDRHLWIKPRSMRGLGHEGMVVDTDHQISTGREPAATGGCVTRTVERRLRVRYVFAWEKGRWWIVGQQETEDKSALVAQ